MFLIKILTNFLYLELRNQFNQIEHLVLLNFNFIGHKKRVNAKKSYIVFIRDQTGIII